MCQSMQDDDDTYILAGVLQVVSGAYDYTVRVWNPDTEECIHVLQGHTNRVYSLQVIQHLQYTNNQPYTQHHYCL